MACPTVRHFCDNKKHRQEIPMCRDRHPDALARCARMLVPADPSKPWHNGDPVAGIPDDSTAPHDGQHAGYGFSVTSLLTW